MNFEDRVLLNELKFTDTDDQIIEYIRENKEKILNQSIQGTAEELFTVPNTIVRLSKKIGYKGFSELKFQLRKEQEDIKSNNFEGAIENSNLISENIIKTINIIDSNIIKKVVRKIKEAKNIQFLGIGDSIYFCEMFTKNLRCLNKKAEFFIYRHDMIYNVEKCNEKDLYIVISVSGESKELIEACEIAKRRGAYIISMTHLSRNTISKLADMNLFFWAPKKIINNYNATDRVGIMILIRTISELFWKN
ncbi:MurR/RpiR family transcriptional regulator [Clostridium sp. ZBS12]|uniref:MurR/RpiR family transcriptional regulator n=1 Tax=Clostridium sp. ZBS12 TaxID=2949972 RepID=UPI002079EA13